jgi:methyl-accepting chemotaxis protein
MFQSSKVTNVLLAIIAICLIAIALKPSGIFPVAPVQAAVGSSLSDLDRLTEITATAKTGQQQVDAVRAVATAIDGLAKSTDGIAKSLDNISRAVTEMGARAAEAQAISPGAATLAPK